MSFVVAKILGASPAINLVRQRILQVANTNKTVLILGDNGTGKELVAKAIQENSPRRDKPYVTLNCSAIPSELIESELFGHEKGAFTGAHAARSGKFTAADGGTLFLDELGDMPLSMQAKLLRALESGESCRVGGNKIEKVDVRVIAATNKDLKSEILAGRFRQDLYYRLNVFPIKVPPLRQRLVDIKLLAQSFLGDRVVSEEGFSVLQKHTWPGNVRELRNVIDRLMILSPSGEIPSTSVAEAMALDVEEHQFEEEISTDPMIEILKDVRNLLTSVLTDRVLDRSEKEESESAERPLSAREIVMNVESKQRGFVIDIQDGLIEVGLNDQTGLPTSETEIWELEKVVRAC